MCIRDRGEIRKLIDTARQSGFENTWYLAKPADSSVIDQMQPTSTTFVGTTDQRIEEPADSPQNLAQQALTISDGTRLRVSDEDIPRIDGAEISIDGKLDEAVWKEIIPFDGLSVLNPDTLEPGRFETLTRVFYDDSGIYVAGHMKQPPDTLVERLSARDESINRDGFSIMLDTSGQGLYGYIFGINLGGTKQDGKLAPENVMSYEWDGAWRGKTSTLSDGWGAELFIPWSILSMPDSDTRRQIGIFVARKVAHIDEFWGWPKLPFSGARFISGFQSYGVEDVG